MKEQIEKYVSIWNSNEVSSLAEVFNEKAAYWDATQAGSAISVLSGSIAATHSAFSDILFQVISIDKTREHQFFLAWKMTGVNTGEFFGYPPTGRKIELEGLDAITFESNKICAVKSFYDSSLFEFQLRPQ